MTYNVCYTDDQLVPINSDFSNDTEIISQENLEEFIESDEWNEPAVKRFLQRSIRETKKFRNIRYSGYTNAAFLVRDIRENKYVPEIIQLDWDFGVGDAGDYIDELLRISKAKIYFLSGNDSTENIEESVRERKKRYGDRGLDVFQKNKRVVEKNSEDNLIEEVISNYTNSTNEQYERYGLKIKFQPSLYLPDYKDFWMIESILGSDYLIDYLKKTPSISEKTIEQLFEGADIKFYLNNTNTRIYSENGLELHKYYKDKVSEKSITPIYAIKNYDLAILETAMEKGTSKIFDSNEK